MPTLDHTHEGKEDEENEVDDNERDSIEQSSSSEEDELSMDEEDSERRRAECADDINHIEKQFNDLKEQLYRERLQYTENQLRDVRCETSSLFTQELKKLDSSKEKRILIAERHMEFKMSSLRAGCDCDLQQARQHLENEMQSLLDNMRSDLEEKLQRAEEDCHHLELSHDAWNEQRPQKRQRRGEGMPEKKRKTTVTGPVIIYMLPEMDIIEDWATIRRATIKSRQKSSSSLSSPSIPSKSPAVRLPNGGTTSDVSHSKLSADSSVTTAYYDDGKLFFQNDWYLRGSKIIVKEHKKDSSVNATITSISQTDVSLLLADGAKMKLPIPQLQPGKTSIAFQE